MPSTPLRSQLYLSLDPSFSTALESSSLSKVRLELPCIQLLDYRISIDVVITGVAYQLTEADPLVDTEQCTRDANMMKTLGANAIRVYHVDPAQDHSGCMSAFATAGIYLFLDLDTFNTQIGPVSKAEF